MSDDIKNQIIELLQKHGCLKRTFFRKAIKADMLQIDAAIAGLTAENKIIYYPDEFEKFSGYKLWSAVFS